MKSEMGLKAGAKLLKKAFADKGVKLQHTEALDLIAKLKGFEAWSHLSSEQRQNISTCKNVNNTVSLSELLKAHYGLSAEYPIFEREKWLWDLREKRYKDNLEYWEWVTRQLVEQDLVEYAVMTVPPSTAVTLPNGQASAWNIEENLTDRWGDLNYHNQQSKPGLLLLKLDEALSHPAQLLESLRNLMWAEDTFIVRKDNKFGVLYEVEYLSQESDYIDGCAVPLKPYSEMKKSLLAKLLPLQQQYPDAEFCVPDANSIYNGRPAVWAFVPMKKLERWSEEKRKSLGLQLNTLTVE